jgi:diguanylate cyclase (GGDEF)-like protein/PAS domain S-box-containing protein
LERDQEGFGQSAQQRDGEECFRSIFHFSPQPIALTELETGTLIEVNDAFCQTVGYAREELLGFRTTDLGFYSGKSRRVFKQTLLSRGRVEGLEMDFRVRDGSVRTALMHSRFVSLHGRRCVLNMLLDITERKRAESALSSNRQRMALALAGTNDGIWDWDRKTDEVFFSTRWKEILGYADQEIENDIREWTSRIHPDDYDRVMEANNRFFTSGDDYFQIEYRLLHRDGSYRWILGRGTCLRDERGEPVRMAGAHSDITERKRAEEALRESKEELEVIYKHAPMIMILVDRNRRVRKANDFALGFAGRSLEELQGMRGGRALRCVSHLEDPNGCGFGEHCRSCAVRLTVMDTFETGQNHYNVETTKEFLRNGNRETFTVLLSTTLLQHKEEPMVLVSINDITDRKLTEEKLRYMSFHDVLTGVYNRNFFEEEMSRLQNRRSGSLAIFICDVNGLKFINDSLGHEKGDELLVGTAGVLKRSFRSGDVIARIGGDEFAVLVPDVDNDEAEAIVSRLRENVEEYNSLRPALPLSLAVGKATSEAAPEDTHALFREADDRMYREKIQRTDSTRSYMVQVLQKAVEARDFETEGHSERLQTMVEDLARSLNLPEETINDLLLLARFHDLGKVGISDSILYKPGPLSREEFREMVQHCEIGYRIVQSVPDLAPIADWILKHHEWWDGRGYPQGLAGEDIPLPCRILAVADAYDAMTSDRPYRRAMSHEEALRELRRYAGTQFDPTLVEKFVLIVENGGIRGRSVPGPS